MAACTYGIGAAPRKTKQRSAKRLQTTSLGYSIAKSTLGRENQTQKVNFVHVLSSFSFFLLSRITRKIYGVCKYYAYQTTSLRPNIFLFWFGAAYEL